MDYAGALGGLYLYGSLREDRNWVFFKNYYSKSQGNEGLFGRKEGTMKIVKLDPDEKNILESFERGEWKTVKDFNKESRLIRQAAVSTLRKDRRVNIRLASRDLEGIRSKAVQEGVPYQTLIASIIHKYVSGHLVSR
jgi:predicted DNA binding CopG/RHH family protein